VFFCVLSLRVYSAHERAVPASYASTTPALAEKLVVPGISNFGKVSDSLYRGSQPRNAGYQELQRLGVSFVVDLRTSSAAQAAEQRTVEALGMQHVALPMSGFFGPSDEQVAAFLKLLRDNPEKKTFVHCYLGDDRTGALVATYRIAEDRWTVDQAYNEMVAFHFHRDLIFIGHYIKSFPENLAKNPILGPFRAPAPTP
jgi:protein tyrosine/serine phosphatase